MSDEEFLDLLAINCIGLLVTSVDTPGGTIVYIGGNQYKGSVYWDDDLTLTTEAIARDLWIQVYVYSEAKREKIMPWDDAQQHHGRGAWWYDHLDELQRRIRWMRDLK
jgi:hypothetical protein